MVAPPVEILRMVNPPPVMPSWLQVLVWVGAGILALGLIWKVIRPLAQMISAAVELTPLLKDLQIELGEKGSLSVLNEIVAQFRTDSGSSLRDVVNRLEATLAEAKARSLAAVMLDEQDRASLARLLILVDRLSVRVDGLQTDSIQKHHDRQGA